MKETRGFLDGTEWCGWGSMKDKKIRLEGARNEGWNLLGRKDI
jgi:hypothetical protein